MLVLKIPLGTGGILWHKGSGETRNLNLQGPWNRLGFFNANIARQQDTSLGTGTVAENGTCRIVCAHHLFAARLQHSPS